MAQNYKRYTFSVPEADLSVIEWMQAQSNVSLSIRTLIREAVRQYGSADITCLRVEQRGPVGRPSYAELQAQLEALRVAAGGTQVQAAPVAQQTAGVPMQPQQAVQHSGTPVPQPAAQPVQQQAAVPAKPEGAAPPPMDDDAIAGMLGIGK